MADGLKYGEVTVGTDSESLPLNGSDEPVFVLRARDQLAIQAIEHYKQICIAVGCNDAHVSGVDEAVGRFAEYASDHTPGSAEFKKPD